MKATVVSRPVAVTLELTVEELLSLRVVVCGWFEAGEVDRRHIAEAKRVLSEAAAAVQQAIDAAAA